MSNGDLRRPRSGSGGSRTRRRARSGDRLVMPRTHTYTPHRTRLALAAAAAVVALLALVAAGCESRADKEAGRYADSFCTDISTWEHQVGGIAATLDTRSPGTVARRKLTA